MIPAAPSNSHPCQERDVSASHFCVKAIENRKTIIPKEFAITTALNDSPARIVPLRRKTDEKEKHAAASIAKVNPISIS